jgi:hypothetical protein
MVVVVFLTKKKVRKDCRSSDGRLSLLCRASHRERSFVCHDMTPSLSRDVVAHTCRVSSWTGDGRATESASQVRRRKKEKTYFDGFFLLPGSFAFTRTLTAPPPSFTQPSASKTRWRRSACAAWRSPPRTRSSSGRDRCVREESSRKPHLFLLLCCIF